MTDTRAPHLVYEYKFVNEFTEGEGHVAIPAHLDVEAFMLGYATSDAERGTQTFDWIERPDLRAYDVLHMVKWSSEPELQPRTWRVFAPNVASAMAQLGQNPESIVKSVVSATLVTSEHEVANG